MWKVVSARSGAVIAEKGGHVVRGRCRTGGCVLERWVLARSGGAGVGYLWFWCELYGRWRACRRVSVGSVERVKLAGSEGMAGAGKVGLPT